eukprot:363302-Chlamydomonas_euryale.AAC.5
MPKGDSPAAAAAPQQHLTAGARPETYEARELDSAVLPNNSLTSPLIRWAVALAPLVLCTSLLVSEQDQIFCALRT